MTSSCIMQEYANTDSRCDRTLNDRLYLSGGYESQPVVNVQQSKESGKIFYPLMGIEEPSGQGFEVV